VILITLSVLTQVAKIQRPNTRHSNSELVRRFILTTRGQDWSVYWDGRHVPQEIDAMRASFHILLRSISSAFKVSCYEYNDCSSSLTWLFSCDLIATHSFTVSETVLPTKNNTGRLSQGLYSRLLVSSQSTFISLPRVILVPIRPQE
jgi:hypothetical protein